MVLNFYDRSWELNEAACPCDVHFVSYLREYRIRGKTIFHFGTGAHHVVALENARLGIQNSILGITCSKLEYRTYMDLVSQDHSVALTYKAIYADAYTLSASVLPEFDVVTLFHLGEYWVGPRDRRFRFSWRTRKLYGGMYGTPSGDAPLDDQGLFDLLWSKTKPGGVMVFYRGSAGWGRTEPVIQLAVASGRIKDAGTHQSLRIFRKVGDDVDPRSDA